MIPASRSVLGVCTRSDRSLGTTLSTVDPLRSQSSTLALGSPIFDLGSSSPTFHRASSSPVFLTVSCKKSFNTQRLVPAPFNEFYRKYSGLTIALHHTVLPPEHSR